MKTIIISTSKFGNPVTDYYKSLGDSFIKNGYRVVFIFDGLFKDYPKETEKLKNVLTLKSVISQIHTIEKGETVGYNRAFKANSTIKTATIPIGHADGISRQFSSGNGYVYIKNKKAPIVGNVCMDMIMVNITDINCNEGDEVLVYKNQFHIEELAKSINTISYEILTAISQRVTRIVN